MLRPLLALSVATLLAGCNPPRAGQGARSTRPGATPPGPASDGGDAPGPPPPVAGLIGTPHPVWVVGAGATGKWVVYCQAREDTDGDGAIKVDIGPHGDPYGDSPSAYLQVGKGPEEPISELVRADPRGRWLVVKLSDRYVLVDAETGQKTDLGFSDRAAGGSLAQADALVSFDAAGERLLHLGPPAWPKLLVRELATGRQTSVDPGPGKLLWATLEGPWVIASMVPRDTNGDGRLDGPRVQTNLSRGGCSGPAATSSSFVISRGDERVVRAVPAAGGAARDVAGFVGVVGDALITRGAAGALLLQRPGGAAPAEIAPASCQGRVIAAHAPTGRLLVACRKGQSKRAALELHGLDVHQSLGEETSLPDADSFVVTSERLVIGAGLVLDPETGKFRRFQASALFALGERILLQSGDTLALADFGSEAEKPLPGRVEPYPLVLLGGRFAYVEPLIVDLVAGTAFEAFRAKFDAGPLFGITEGRRRPHAASQTGHFLVSDDPPPARMFGTIYQGPLAWAWPDPRVRPLRTPARGRPPPQ